MKGVVGNRDEMDDEGGERLRHIAGLSPRWRMFKAEQRRGSCIVAGRRVMIKFILVHGSGAEGRETNKHR